MILVVILVLAWLVILGPGLLRRRSEHGGGVSSISHFHRQLRVLEHSGTPPLVAPAYRLQCAPGSDATTRSRYPDVATVPVLTVVGADLLPRPALAFLGDPEVETLPGRGANSDHGGWMPDMASATMPRPIDPFARQLARKRRRDTLMVLALIFGCTLLIGFIPGARTAWVVSALAAVALGAYVALLVHLRSLAEEREQKLHYLRPRPYGVSAFAPGVEVYDGPMAASAYATSRQEHPAGRAAAR